MENKEEIKYIYLGDNLNLPEFRFTKSGVYYGDKVTEMIIKYPLLKKLLIKIEELPNFNMNETIIGTITEEIRQEVEGGNN